MRLVITALVGLGALGALAFMLLYLRSRGWYRTHVGQNLMAMAAALFGLLALVLVGRVVHIPAWLWAGGIASLDAVLWWRVVILWQLQRVGS